MISTLLKNPVGTNRVQQIANAFLLAVMEKNILTKKVLESMPSRMIKRGVYPAILGRMQVTADRKIISPIEKLLERSVVIIGIANTYPTPHWLNCKQPVDIAIQQVFERDIGVILTIPMCITQQMIQMGITIMVLRHQHQCIL